MKFKEGDIVELNHIGVEHYKKKYSNHVDVINSTFRIYNIIGDGAYSCKFVNTDLIIWIREDYIQLDKKHYRKEKLKQLRNGI
jgi:hypothetical protein